MPVLFFIIMWKEIIVTQSSKKEQRPRLNHITQNIVGETFCKTCGKHCYISKSGKTKKREDFVKTVFS